MRVVEPFICNFDDRIIKVHWRINGQAAEGQMGRVGDGEVESSLVEEEEGVKITNEWLYPPHEGLFVFSHYSVVSLPT